MIRCQNTKQCLKYYRLSLLAIILSGVFWLLEALLHVLIWEGTTLFVAIFTPPGHEIWMRLTIMSIFIAFGFYGDRLIAALRDAEDATNLANAESAQIVETSADGMRIVDKDFNVLRANQAFAEMAGIARNEVIGKKCYEVFHGHRCDTPDCPLVKIINGEERVEYDSDKQTLDGTIIPCIVTATPFRKPDGTLIGIVEDFKDISERIKSDIEIRESHERLRELTTHLQRIREEERSRIAREIHDELGQALTALNMDVFWLRKRLPKDGEEMLDKTAAMSDLINNTVSSVRKICLELRPSLLDDFGLSTAIESLADEFTQRSGISCEICSIPEEVVIDKNISIVIYRVFQEALTNILRHAEATRVEVNLSYQSEIFKMRVRDNGRGITKSKREQNSWGLIGMQERVNGLGGEFNIDSDNSGTTIDISIPVISEEAPSHKSNV